MNTPKKEPGQPGSKTAGRGWKRMLKKALWVIPSGCLTLVVVMVLVNWLALRALAPKRPERVKEYSFQEALGRLEPTGSTPTLLPLDAPMASHLLPEILSVTDAVEKDGEWILLDRRSGKIHFLDPIQGLRKSIGREGQGPEELSDPVAMALADTTLWVLNQKGLALDRLALPGAFLNRHRLQEGGCLVGLAKGLATLPSGDLYLLRFCPPTLPGPGTVWLERVAPTGKLRPLLSLPLGNPGSRKIPFMREPLLGVMGETLFIGTMDAPCMLEVSSDGSAGEPRCLPPYTRPKVPDAEVDQLQGRFQGITKLGLLPLEIPDELPWYDQVFSTAQGLVFRRLRGMEERDLVLVSRDGPIFVADTLFPEKTFVGNRTIMVVTERIEGTELTFFPVPW